ncbi:hypothetical protein BH11PLA2_BH11PLA2_32490 [soil metagenome]
MYPVAACRGRSSSGNTYDPLGTVYTYTSSNTFEPNLPVGSVLSVEVLSDGSSGGVGNLTLAGRGGASGGIAGGTTVLIAGAYDVYFSSGAKFSDPDTTQLVYVKDAEGSTGALTDSNILTDPWDYAGTDGTAGDTNVDGYGSGGSGAPTAAGAGAAGQNGTDGRLGGLDGNNNPSGGDGADDASGNGSSAVGYGGGGGGGGRNSGEVGASGGPRVKIVVLSYS